MRRLRWKCSALPVRKWERVWLRSKKNDRLSSQKIVRCNCAAQPVEPVVLPRTHINPPGHWVTEPKLNYSQAVRCGELIYTTGQVALDTNLTVIAATDLPG